MTMLQRIQAYRAEGSKIVPEWHQFVTSKAAPLNERWETYWTAPPEWRVRNPDSSDIPVNSLCRLFDSPYDDFNMERGSAKTMKNIIEKIEDKLSNNKVEGLTQDLIDASKEEIMDKKLGEWTYDW